MKYKLLASASTIERLHRLIAQYFCCNTDEIIVKSTDGIIFHLYKNDRLLNDYSVHKKSKRYRFEISI
jgi:hypothetical protein